MKPLLILGTGNRKKGRELAELVAPLGVEVRTLADYPGTPTVDETGRTFADNARLKAVGYATLLKQWVLADDSGLAVDKLGGRPGVDSALYAGKHGDDEANNDLLLRELGDAPPEQRWAPLRLPLHVGRSAKARFASKAKTSAAAGSSRPATAPAASATTRSSKSSSITARSARSARNSKPSSATAPARCASCCPS